MQKFSSNARNADSNTMINSHMEKYFKSRLSPKIQLGKKSVFSQFENHVQSKAKATATKTNFVQNINEDICVYSEWDLQMKSFSFLLYLIYESNFANAKILNTILQKPINIEASKLNLESFQNFLKKVRNTYPVISKPLLVLILKIINLAWTDKFINSLEPKLLSFYVQVCEHYAGHIRSSQNIIELTDFFNQYLEFTYNLHQSNTSKVNRSEICNVTSKYVSKVNQLFEKDSEIPTENLMDIISSSKIGLRCNFFAKQQIWKKFIESILLYLTRSPFNPVIVNHALFSYHDLENDFIDLRILKIFFNKVILKNISLIDVNVLFKILMEFKMYPQIKYLLVFFLPRTTLSLSRFTNTPNQYGFQTKNEDAFIKKVKSYTLFLKIYEFYTTNLEVDFSTKNLRKKYLSLNQFEMERYASKYNEEMIELKTYIVKITSTFNSINELLIQHYSKFRFWAQMELTERLKRLLSDYVCTLRAYFEPSFGYFENTHFFIIIKKKTARDESKDYLNTLLLQEGLFCLAILQNHLHECDFLRNFSELLVIFSYEDLASICRLKELDFDALFSNLVGQFLAFLEDQQSPGRNPKLFLAFGKLLGKFYSQIQTRFECEIPHFADRVRVQFEKYLAEIAPAMSMNDFLEFSFICKDIIVQLGQFDKCKALFEVKFGAFFENCAKGGSEVRVSQVDDRKVVEVKVNTFALEDKSLKYLMQFIDFYQLDLDPVQLDPLVGHWLKYSKILHGKELELAILALMRLQIFDISLARNLLHNLNTFNNYINNYKIIEISTSLKHFSKNDRLLIFDYFLKIFSIHHASPVLSSINFLGLFNLILPILDLIELPKLIKLLGIIGPIEKNEYFYFYLKVAKHIENCEAPVESLMLLNKFTLGPKGLEKCVEFISEFMSGDLGPEDLDLVVRFVTANQIEIEWLFQTIYSLESRLSWEQVNSMVLLTPIDPPTLHQYFEFGLKFFGCREFEHEEHFLLHFFIKYFDPKNKMKLDSLFPQFKNALFDYIQRNKIFVKYFVDQNGQQIELWDSFSTKDISIFRQNRELRSEDLNKIMKRDNFLKVDKLKHFEFKWNVNYDSNFYSMSNDLKPIFFKYYIVYRFGEELIDEGLLSSQALASIEFTFQEVINNHFFHFKEYLKQEKNQNFNDFLNNNESYSLENKFIHLTIKNKHYYIYESLKNNIVNIKNKDKSPENENDKRYSEKFLEKFNNPFVLSIVQLFNIKNLHFEALQNPKLF